MRKITFIIVSLLLLATNVYTKQRTESEALNLASAFYQQSSGFKLKAAGNQSLQLAYTSMRPSYSTGKEANYYVYNIGENAGFVIISGDDRAKSILGYSDNGSFDINVIPENFRAWLNFYQSELEALAKQPESISSNDNTLSLSYFQQNKAFAGSIAPLLGGIKWDQGMPYNDLCPAVSGGPGGNAVTGCVATAMAQVMKYYQWPVKGAGSNGYTTTTLNIMIPAVDFSQTTYDWANMTNTYNTSSTTAQKDAVATLMYHCGVAVNMDYGLSSGASSYNMVNAMINNFGYDANAQRYMRDYHTKAEWEDMIKSELNAQRPVLYDGQSSGGGHQFVCDGYDTNGLYHFNWGWSGMSDGYFELSALNPGALGAGGGSGGYNSNQGIALGIQKPDVNSQYSNIFYMQKPLEASASTVGRNNSFGIKAFDMYNYGVNAFTGYLGVALYDLSNNLVAVLIQGSVNNLSPLYGWSTFDSFSSMTVPSSVANGNYKIYYVYKSTLVTQDWQIVRGKVGTPGYLNAEVTSTNVNFSTPTNVQPVLSLNSLSVTGNLYQDKLGRVVAKITNTGGEYNSYLAILLQLKSNSSVYQFVTMDPVNIATGETKEFELSGKVTMTPGDYYLAAMYDPANNRAQSSITFNSVGSAISVSVLPTPAAPNLTLASKIAFADNNNVYKNSGVLTAVFNNSGGLFDGQVIAFVFPVIGGTSLDYYGPINPIIDNGETQIIHFSGSLDLPVPVEYRIIVYSRNTTTSSWIQLPGGNNDIRFTLVEDLTVSPGLVQEAGASLYPNPVIDKLYLKTEDIVKHISIFDIFGKIVISFEANINGEIMIPVEKLSSGTYILRLETYKGMHTQKFIKK